MRINKFVAACTGLSRRAADDALSDGRVLVNWKQPTPGHDVTTEDVVTLNGKQLYLPDTPTTVMFHKPAGYITSRNGQGRRTIYDLLPKELHHLKPVGRLDKESSGLLLLTNDGDLAQRLTHPSYRKVKLYQIQLFKPLQPLHRQMISDIGIQLEDGRSKLALDRLIDGDDAGWLVTMYEGRNRQIRRTFLALGYGVARLHRIQFGDYRLGTLKEGTFRDLASS